MYYFFQWLHSYHRNFILNNWKHLKASTLPQLKQSRFLSITPYFPHLHHSVMLWLFFYFSPVLGISYPSSKQSSFQKQPFRGILRKSFSKNMQHIYRRIPMPKSDFNKVSKQRYWNHTSAWVFSCKFAAYFQNTFS